MKSLVERIRTFGTYIWGEPNRDLVLSILHVRHHGVLYRVSAVYDGVRVMPEPDGQNVLFSVEKGSPHRDLALEVFDGFEWNLTRLAEMLDRYESMADPM